MPDWDEGEAGMPMSRAGRCWHYFTDTVAGAAVGVGTVCALALVIDLAAAASPR